MRGDIDADWTFCQASQYVARCCNFSICLSLFENFFFASANSSVPKNDNIFERPSRAFFNFSLQSLYIIFVFQHLFTIVMAVSFMSNRSIHAKGSGVLRGHKQIMIDDNEIRVISD